MVVLCPLLSGIFRANRIEKLTRGALRLYIRITLGLSAACQKLCAAASPGEVFGPASQSPHLSLNNRIGERQIQVPPLEPGIFSGGIA